MFVIQNVACNTELKSILAYLRHWTTLRYALNLLSNATGQAKENK